MDTQIWYAVYCTIFGGVSGIFHHLGEIRTMGMLRSRFQSLPAAFNVCLVPPSLKKEYKKNVGSFFRQRCHKVSENDKNGVAKFAQVWNQIINSFRSEDLISNREMDLMTIPLSSELSEGLIRWPVFLLATKFSTALDMARDFVGKEEHLCKKIKKDYYMYCAVMECYESLKNILGVLVVGDLEKRIIAEIIYEIETSINKSSLLADFKMSELPALHSKCIELANILLENERSHHDKVIKLLQDIFEVVTKDIMTHGSRILDLISCPESPEGDAVTFFRQHEPELFASRDSNNNIRTLPMTVQLKQQIRRLLLLLTVKETAMDIPKNLEARRRISFFATSLFMNMPSAPKVRNMLSFRLMAAFGSAAYFGVVFLFLVSLYMNM